MTIFNQDHVSSIHGSPAPNAPFWATLPRPLDQYPVRGWNDHLIESALKDEPSNFKRFRIAFLAYSQSFGQDRVQS